MKSQKEKKVMLSLAAISSRFLFRSAALILAGGALTLFAPCRLSAAPPSAADPLADNPKLDQKVKIVAEGIPIRDLLALLSQKTGVMLSARDDIADDKAIVFSPARPLKAAMADLAALFNNEWMRRKTKDGTDEYILLRSNPAREREERLAQTMSHRLAFHLGAQVQALGETPEQLAARPPHDLIRETLSRPTGRLATAFYALLSPAQRETLFARSRFDIAFTELSPPQQAALQRAFQDVNARAASNNGADAPTPSGLPDDLERSVLRFERFEQGGTDNLALTCEPKGYGIDGLTIARVDNRADWLLPAHGNPYTGQPIAKNTVLSASEEIRAATEQRHWIDRLHKLADATLSPVFADLYRSRAVHLPRSDADSGSSAASSSEVSNSRTPKGSAVGIASLDALCRPDGYLWWTGGNTLYFRKRDWFIQQTFEVSDRWLLDVAARLQSRNGVPTYGDLFQITRLTPEQIAGLNSLTGDPSHADLSRGKRAARGCRELLAVWQASPSSSNVPIPPSVLPDGRAPKRVALAWRDMNGRERDAASLFLAGRYDFGLNVPELDHPLVPEQIETFETRLFVQPADVPTPATNANYSASADAAAMTGVALFWQTQSVGPVSCRLFLPLSLPDDRRDRTRVELVL